MKEEWGQCKNQLEEINFRRRKNLYSHHQNHSLGSVSGTGSGCQSSVLGAVQGTHIGNQSAIHHQLTLQKVGTQLRHHLSPALSLTSTLSFVGTCSKTKDIMLFLF